MKKVIILAAFLILTMPAVVWADVPIDEDHFPDEVFRTYVAENFDTDGDKTISESEAEIVTEICVPNMGISSLVGVE